MASQLALAAGAPARGPAPTGSSSSTWTQKARHGARDVVPAWVLESDALLHQLSWLRHGLVLPLARAASALSWQSAWLACGYRNAEDFCRESFQRSGRWLRNLVCLHEATQRLPGLGAAVAGADDGWPLGQMAALAIARVATPVDVGSWIARARGRGLEALRQDVQRLLEERGVEASDTPEHEPYVESRLLLRLEVPPEVALMHEAVRDLHRAFAGQETGLGGFVEAVLGEVSDRGLEKADDFRPHVTRFDAGGRPAAGRHAQAEAWELRRWRTGSAHEGIASSFRSGHGARTTPGIRQAQRVLAEFEKLEASQALLVRSLERTASSTCASARKIRRLVAVVRKLVCLENRLEIACGDLSSELQDEGAWPLLGYGSLEAYAEERLGLGRTAARGRASLARQLRRLPPVREAYVTGRLGLEKVQILVRALRDRPEAQAAAWIEAVSKKTVRRLRQEERLLRAEVLEARVAVAQSLTRWRGEGVGSSVGRFPPPGRPGLPVRREPVDDATWRASLRRVPGKTLESLGGLGWGLAGRVAHEGPLLAVPLRLALREDLALELQCWIEAARRALAERPRCTPAEECRLVPSTRIASSFLARGERVPDWVGYLALLEACAFVWDTPERGGERDGVVERDGYQCMAPGCTARRDLQRHHLVYRSEGGDDTEDNRIVLCVVHHQQGEHGGQARCRGKAPLEVVWRLGAAALGTWWLNDRQLAGPA